MPFTDLSKFGGPVHHAISQHEFFFRLVIQESECILKGFAFQCKILGPACNLACFCVQRNNYVIVIPANLIGYCVTEKPRLRSDADSIARPAHILV